MRLYKLLLGLSRVRLRPFGCLRQRLRRVSAGQAGTCLCPQNRDMRSEIADKSFGTVLDKGTLDAILCGDNAHESAARLLLECSRCGRPWHPSRRGC